MGFTEILLDRLPPDSKENEILKTIERQGLNAKRIVEKLMTYARQPAKQEEFTDLNKDIEMVTSLLQNNLFTNKIELELRLARELPRVHCDSGELQQVFINLVNNAINYTKEGEVSIQTRKTEDQILVEVTDTGCGIPKENLSKIFEPFYSTKGQKGTGLGLSVIWGIIDNHNGTIEVSSQLNKGTIFTIHLPAGKNLKSSAGKTD